MGVENEQLTPEAERILREIHDHCREPGIIDVTYWSKVFQEKSGAYVSRLRKLLKEFKDNPQHISTCYELGGQCNAGIPYSEMLRQWLP